jgi:hypothetical protein
LLHLLRLLTLSAVGLLTPLEAPAAPDEDGAAQGCTRGADDSFMARLLASYRAHLAWDGGEPSRTVDGVAVPESSPPWPYASWNIGGSELIGVENRYSSALMDALYCGDGGARLKDSRFTIYGWLEPGGNLSTSRSHFNFATGTGGNYPAAYSYEPNYAQLDQATIYLERTPDEVQREHVDWGFRVTGLYGTDYKYTFSNGILSSQYLNKEKRYGFDPVMYYFEFWLPHIAQGENLRIGRYVSVPDIEAQLAPNNITYSHSLLYTYDPYTQTGVVSTTKLSKNWQVQMELSAGNDVAPWIKSERHLTPALCVLWTSNSGKDNLYPCMNTLNDSRWRWNNVQHAVLTWYHKINARWHLDSEIWYMWQSHTPNISNAAGASYLAQAYAYVNIGAPSGAQCNPALAFCYSYEWALVNYLNYQIGARDIVTLRSDYLNDARGQRTGFKARYSEFDLGYTHWIGDVIELRPELRFENARNAAAYDNPSGLPGAGRHSQLMLAADAIVHF